MGKNELLVLFRSTVQRLRDRMNLSQTEVAKRAKMTSGYICDLEHGRRSQNVATMAPIAEALEVHPCELIAPAGLEDVLHDTIHDKTFSALVQRLHRAYRGTSAPELAAIVNDKTFARLVRELHRERTG